jgi:hypothetical protein
MIKCTTGSALIYILAPPIHTGTQSMHKGKGSFSGLDNLLISRGVRHLPYRIVFDTVMATGLKNQQRE